MVSSGNLHYKTTQEQLGPTQGNSSLLEVRLLPAVHPEMDADDTDPALFGPKSNRARLNYRYL